MTTKRINWKLMVLGLAIFLAANISALAKNSITIDVTQSISLNGTQISPGEYRVAWVTHSPETTVTFMRESKTTATANAKLVDRDTKYSVNQLVFQDNPDGSRTLMEIRLKGTSQALVFVQ